MDLTPALTVLSVKVICTDARSYCYSMTQGSAQVLPVLLTGELNGSGPEEKEGTLGNHAVKRSPITV